MKIKAKAVHEQNVYIETEKIVAFTQVARALIEDLLKEYSPEEISRIWRYVIAEK
jgi:hypothetical protein